MEIKIKDNEIVVDGKTYVLKEEKPLPSEPEFKVGDWVIGRIPDSGGDQYYPRLPERIKEIDNGMYLPDEYNGREKGEEFYNSFDFIRHATKDEVESYLIGVAKEKGFVDGASYVWTKDVVTGKVVYPLHLSGNLNAGKVWLTCANSGVIYDDDGWAQVIPAKKPVPQTREEFQNFLGSAFQLQPQNRDTANEFLDQYDFNEQIS